MYIFVSSLLIFSIFFASCSCSVSSSVIERSLAVEANAEDCKKASEIAQNVFRSFELNQMVYYNDPVSRQEYLATNFSRTFGEDACFRYRSYDGFQAYLGPGPEILALNATQLITHKGEHHTYGEFTCIQVSRRDYIRSDYDPDAFNSQCVSSSSNQKESTSSRRDKVHLLLTTSQDSLVLLEDDTCQRYRAFNQFWVEVQRCGEGIDDRCAVIKYMSLDVIEEEEPVDSCKPFNPPPASSYLRMDNSCP